MVMVGIPSRQIDDIFERGISVLVKREGARRERERKEAISCEPITNGESVPVSRRARRSNIWDPFFFPSVSLFPTYALAHPTSYYRG